MSLHKVLIHTFGTFTAPQNLQPSLVPHNRVDGVCQGLSEESVRRGQGVNRGNS